MYITHIQIQYREPPRSVIKRVAFEPLYSDYDRVKILKESGGIYLDLDVMAVRSFDDLRKYRCTMGIEHDEVLNGGIIVCEKDHPFLHMWLNSFYDDLQYSWAYNSGQVPSKLALRYPDLIHVEPRKLHYPNWSMMGQIWGNEKYPWKENYAIHTWIRLAKWRDHPDEDSIKTSPSTFAQIARLVYYN